MDSISNLNRILDKQVSVIKTGIVQQYSGTQALIAVEGSLLTLEVLDHVTLDIGLVAVCSIYGRTGYVIGTLGVTNRAVSDLYEGGYGNPLAPDAIGNQTYVAEFAPTARRFWIGTGGTSSLRWRNVNTVTTPTTSSGFYTLADGSSIGDAGVGYMVYFYDSQATLADSLAVSKIEMYLDTWKTSGPTSIVPDTASKVFNTFVTGLSAIPSDGDATPSPTTTSQTNALGTTSQEGWVDLQNLNLVTSLKDGTLASIGLRKKNLETGMIISSRPQIGTIRVTYIA